MIKKVIISIYLLNDLKIGTFHQIHHVKTANKPYCYEAHLAFGSFDCSFFRR